jgi:glutamate-1-semialdehyde aminotransferase
MNEYAKTSKYICTGFQSARRTQIEYRQAAEARQSASQIVADLYAQGKDLRKALENLAKAESEFWSVDHYARRYGFFYTSSK